MVRIEKENGYNIIYGDSKNSDVLKHIGIEKCESVIIAMDDELTCINITKYIHKKYPNATVITKSESLNNAHRFRKVGASYVVSKNLETGLQMGHAALASVGINNNEISDALSSYRDINDDILNEPIIPHRHESSADDNIFETNDNDNDNKN